MIALALASCSRAEAVPPSALQVPAGWQPLPEIAAAAGEAARGEGVTIESAQAWGETAMGCYALALKVRGAKIAPADVERELRASLPGVTIKDPIVGGDSVSLVFERANYSGVLGVRVMDTGALAATACFWNEREPKACGTACAGILAQ
jgi:hypothetical protein